MREIDFLIIGAGASGLTLASEFLEAGKSVFIVERDERIGGLAKSYSYEDHVFDTGPKRFHTEDPIVNDFIKRRSSHSHIQIGRRSAVHFDERFLSWPLDLPSLLKLPFKTSLSSFVDLLKREPNSKIKNFKDYILLKYGETLYREFFAPYTKKFLNVDPESVHQDWAHVGINRAVIDDSVKVNNLKEVVTSILPTLDKRAIFSYPQKGGFGSFFEDLFNFCLSFGSPQFGLSLSAELKNIQTAENYILAETNKGELIKAQNLIWTGNINSILNLLRIDTPTELKYLNTAFYNIIVKESSVKKIDSQWIYISGQKELVSRISLPGEFNSNNCPSGYKNLTIEITDSQQTPQIFGRSEEFKDQILFELTNLGILKNKIGVESIHINEVKDTYPIYLKSYKKAYLEAHKLIKTASPLIHLSGRSGAFWYNNSDHSIRMGIEMAKLLLNQSRKEFDHRSYFGAPSGHDIN